MNKNILFSFYADETLTFYSQRDRGKIFVKSNNNDRSGYIELIDGQLIIPDFVECAIDVSKIIFSERLVK